jgi:DNA-directed RNA polymerase specialized sigma24 family protein
MRETLVNHAQNRKTTEHGGDHESVALDEIVEYFERVNRVGLVALDHALTKLDQGSPSQRALVELRLFGGLSVEQIADLLGVSSAHVELDWRLACAKLYLDLGKA